MASRRSAFVANDSTLDNGGAVEVSAADVSPVTIVLIMIMLAALV